MNRALILRAQLFASIEPGTNPISKDLSTEGPEVIFERLRNHYYKIDTRDIFHTNGEEVLEKIESAGFKFITPGEKFEELAAPPIGLIARGNCELIEKDAISIVGTRNPTPYGSRIAGDMAANFADRGWVIVSGGAYGIDSFAHKGALIAEGETIAVLASGLDVTYPAGHFRMFEEIAESGLLLSEYMPGTKALPHRFLQRNRLIAALGKGTMVVEAAFRSGALRTAADANLIHRIVMAIPGPITSPLSEGCHRLIGEHKAAICLGLTDALELMGPCNN